MTGIHACCQLDELRHANTCHDCGAVEVPMSASASAERGEPICVNCAANGATS